MKRFLFAAIGLLTVLEMQAQTPVPIASQPMLTYLETFDSVINWTNNFASGTGADRFASVAVGGTATIPDPTRITTSSAAWSTGSSAGLQRDTVNGRLLMVVSGTTNNTTAVAFDVFFDFSGTGAGNLSFDWDNIFNGSASSNRTATLKVYGSTNGTTFTELPSASVTLTNNVAATGTLSNISLPASFTNSPTARLRFYYYNSAGGTTGSRPILALNNLKVTGSGTPCSTPLASATNLSFSAVTPTSISGSFVPASPAPDEYLVIATPLGSLSSLPVDSNVYQIGDIVGDGLVIYRGSGNAFTASNLSPQTNYSFFVFSSNIYCNGAAKYNTTSPLTGSQSTPAGPPCVAPSSAASGLAFQNITTNSIAGTFGRSADASEYLVLVSSAASPSIPPQNGTVYNTGDTLGNAIVAYRGADTNFVVVNLNHSTNYNFFIYSLNNYACSNGPAYLTSTLLTGSQSTAQIFPCVTPWAIASNLGFTSGNDFILGYFNPANAAVDGYLVVVSNSSTLSALPQNGIIYTKGATLGNGTVVSIGSNYSFTVNGLNNNTTYHFFIFSYNDICIGGPLYRTGSFLSGSATTGSPQPYHFYFGNLHAHSSYSDGNKDNAALTPTDDYNYAQNAQCMDFLGISEHNHYTQADNPGMLLPYYQQGLNEASSYTSGHPGFLALYGMEWGTTANLGGHVLVYGTDSLMGWEQVNGLPNYNTYVRKNDFLSDTGLFNKVMALSAHQAFATLAHPSFTDFENLALSAFSTRADSVLTGIAVESGPAFSTNTTYTEPASSMWFLPYYQHMLAKGYHIAPMIDHDNHNTTFGRTAKTRTAVISASLSKTDFMQAMRERHFYATQDCDAKVTFQVYQEQMGSIVTHAFAPALALYVSDSTDATTIPEIKLMRGTPGSGALATVIKTVQDYALSFTDLSLNDSATAYYYAQISLGNKQIITAPIWYTRNDTGNIVANSVLQEPNAATSNVSIKNNPAQSHLQVEVVSPKMEQVHLEVFSLSGTMLLHYNAGSVCGMLPFQISIDHLPAGLYLLRATVGHERVNLKFVHY